MSLVFKDRVLESSTTTGTGTYTLAGAVAGFQDFSAVGNGNTCYYAAVDVDSGGVPQGGWEVGLGTYTAAGTTLARTSILASSNSNNAVNWAAGTRRVFLTEPASFVVTPTLTAPTLKGLTLFASGDGLSFAGAGPNPITMVGGDDGAGDTAIIIDDATDAYVYFKYPHGRDEEFDVDSFSYLGDLTVGLSTVNGHYIELSPASASSGTHLYAQRVITHWNATDGDATADGMNLNAADIHFGDGGVGAIGTVEGFYSNFIVSGSGSANNEFAPYFGYLSVDIGTGYTQAIGPVGRMWMFDSEMHGSVAVQPANFSGFVNLMNNYYNGSPSDHPSVAYSAVTLKGAGNANAGHVAANTYPLDIGFLCSGYSNAGADTTGWEVAFQAGGTQSAWGESKSIIGTGFKARNCAVDIDADGGVVILANLPTSDPAVVGQLYTSSGVLHVSAG